MSSLVRQMKRSRGATAPKHMLAGLDAGAIDVSQPKPTSAKNVETRECGAYLRQLRPRDPPPYKRDFIQDFLKHLFEMGSLPTYYEV